MGWTGKGTLAGQALDKCWLSTNFQLGRCLLTQKVPTGLASTHRPDTLLAHAMAALTSLVEERERTWGGWVEERG